MNWFFIALAAPALWALVNHIDKYIISKYFTGKGVGSLVLFTSLSGVIISVFILMFSYNSLNIGLIPAIIIGVNGAILVASFIPYLYALEDEEASYVTSLFQLIPVFTYFLALIFLHEYLTPIQIFASSLVVVGAILISFDFSHSIRFKIRPFLLMVLSTFMLAVNALIFKIVAVGANFWGTAFWEYIGGGIFGVILFFSFRLYREQFIATIQKSKVTVLTLNTGSELFNIAAKLLANFASLLVPLTLVWVVNGFQPMIVFIYGVILTIFIPRWGKEDLGKKVVIQKVSAMLIIFLGILLLFR